MRNAGVLGHCGGSGSSGVCALNGWVRSTTRRAPLLSCDTSSARTLAMKLLALIVTLASENVCSDHVMPRIKLPHAEQEKRKQRHHHPQFGRAAYLFFLFPAKELGSNRKTNRSGNNQCDYPLPVLKQVLVIQNDA